MPNWGAMAGGALGAAAGFSGMQAPGRMMPYRKRPQFDPTMARNAGARTGVQQQQQLPQQPDAGGMQQQPYEMPDYLTGGPLPPPSGMAQGGIVTQPTTALIGENGPEMVVPLSGQQGAARVGPGNAMGMNYRRG